MLVKEKSSEFIELNNLSNQPSPAAASVAVRLEVLLLVPRCFKRSLSADLDDAFLVILENILNTKSKNFKVCMMSRIKMSRVKD